MTDDYRLFEPEEGPSDGGPPVDPDVALISAYLARELSPVQVAAVEGRLATDAAFAEAVQPVLDAWVTPIAARAEPIRTGWTVDSSALVSPQELKAGWERHVAAVGAGGKQTGWRHWRPGIRAAAVIALFLLPAMGIGQVVVYVSQVDAPPGTSFAQKAVGLVRGTLKHRRASPTPTPARPAPVGSTTVASAPSPLASTASNTQREGAAAQLPAIRPLGPIEAQLPVVLKIGQTFASSVPSIRQLSDGRVLLSDRTARRLLLLDSSFANQQVILDPVTTNPTPDSTRPRGGPAVGTLIPFSGDSSLFVNYEETGYTVIGPHGETGRTIPGAQLFSSPAPGSPAAGRGAAPLFASADATDNTGHFVNRPTMETARRLPFPNDTMPLIRLGPDSRKDTVGTRSAWNLGGWYATKEAILTWVKVPVRRDSYHLDATPVPVNDDWAMLADGSVAVIRASDFHIDWFEPDGTHRSTPRAPFEWVRVSSERKQRLVDSLLAFYSAHPNPNGYLNVTTGTPLPTPPIVAPSALPDSVPPFGGATALGDVDLRVWIRVTANGELPDALGPRLPGDHAVVKSIRPPLIPLTSLRPPLGPPVYYVINKRGIVVDRVQLPMGWRPLGFGSGDKVYLIREKPCIANGFPCQPHAEWEIARARLR